MRKTLVLDLDNTLVASFSTSKAQLLGSCDYVVSIPREKYHDTITIAVFKRPHLEEFLDVACSLFDVWIFTASDKSYAQPVCENLLNSKERFKGCLFRDSLVKGGKDLSIFNVNMDQIMIIDDDEFNFQNNPKNGVTINSFGFDTITIQKELRLDHELRDFIPLLKSVADSPTVFEPILQYKQFHSSNFQNCDISPLTSSSSNTPAVTSFHAFSPFDDMNDEKSPNSATSASSDILI